LLATPVYAQDPLDVLQAFIDRSSVLERHEIENPADFDDPPDRHVDVDSRLPDFVRVIEFGDYAYRAPSDYGSDPNSYDHFVTYEKWLVSNRTTFMAFNGSLEDAKVRVQGLSSIGTIFWEYDIGVPPGHTTQILRYVLDSKSDPKPSLFVISSNRPLIVTAHTIEGQSNYYASGDKGFDYLAVSEFARASQTSLPVKDIDCRVPEGFEWLCAVSVKQTDWSAWIVAPGQSPGTIINP
jgi:hypothetical protein